MATVDRDFLVKRGLTVGQNITVGSTHTVVLGRDPTSNLEAATKQYVDAVAQTGGGGTDISTASIDDLLDVVITDPTSGDVLKWDGTSWYNDSSGAVGPTGPTGPASVFGVTVDQFTGDGNTTTFTLSTTPEDENHTLAAIQGVFQFKTSYSLSGNQIIFSEAPPNNYLIEISTLKGGSIGPTGPVGSIGPTGPTGPTGPASTLVGPTGPTGPLPASQVSSLYSPGGLITGLSSYTSRWYPPFAITVSKVVARVMSAGVQPAIISIRVNNEQQYAMTLTETASSSNNTTFTVPTGSYLSVVITDNGNTASDLYVSFAYSIDEV